MTTALTQMKQWVVSSLPGNKEKLKSDPILVNCDKQLNKLLEELTTIKHQFVNYAEQQVNATEATVTLSKTIHQFYTQANHPGRAESVKSVKSVNAYKQVQEDIATNAVKTFHIDLHSSGLLTQLNIWVENIDHLKEQIEGCERARITSFQTQNRLLSLQQELTKKKQQPIGLFGNIGNSNKDQDLDHLKQKIQETSNVQKSMHQDFIQVRNAVENQVNLLMNQRFIHFDSIYVQILECQLKFYEYAQQQSKRFERDIEYYRNQYPNIESISVSISRSVTNDEISVDVLQNTNNNSNNDPSFFKRHTGSNDFSGESFDSVENLNNKPPTHIKRGHQKRGSGKIRHQQQFSQPKMQHLEHKSPTIHPASAPTTSSNLTKTPTTTADNDDEDEDGIKPGFQKQGTIHQDFIGDYENHTNESKLDPFMDLLSDDDGNGTGNGIITNTNTLPIVDDAQVIPNTATHDQQPSWNLMDMFHTSTNTNTNNNNNNNNNMLDSNNNSEHNKNMMSMNSIFASMQSSNSNTSVNNSNDDKNIDTIFDDIFNNDPVVNKNLSKYKNVNFRKSVDSTSIKAQMKYMSSGSKNRSFSTVGREMNRSQSEQQHNKKNAENIRLAFRSNAGRNTFKLSAAAQARVDAVVKERIDFVNSLHDKEDEEVRIREETILKYGEQLKEWEFEKTVRRNIRTLLCKLSDVLPAHLGWKPVSVAQLLNPSQIKKAYFRAVRIVHPDKAMHRNDSVEVRVVCERIFQALDCAYKAEF